MGQGYEQGETGAFYDLYAEHEWNRLHLTPYGRLQAIIHTDFLRKYVANGDLALDAGCGPGRFAVEMARIGATITLLDTSSVQLNLAKEQLTAAGLVKSAEAFVQADIVNLSRFEDEMFDVTVCYGGALTYVRDARHQAATELVRVTKPGGVLLVSVMSRYGSTAALVRRPAMTSLRDPNEWWVWQVVETGELPPIPSQRVQDKLHPAMHLYTSDELRGLFSDCEVLEMAGSNVVGAEGAPTWEEIGDDLKAWETTVELERRLCTVPGLVDNGSHMILVARRS